MRMHLAAHRAPATGEVEPQITDPRRVDVVVRGRGGVSWDDDLVDVGGAIRRPDPEDDAFDAAASAAAEVLERTSEHLLMQHQPHEWPPPAPRGRRMSVVSGWIPASASVVLPLGTSVVLSGR